MMPESGELLERNMREASRERMMQPVQGWEGLETNRPRVATQNGGASRPWGGGRNPIGIALCDDYIMLNLRL
jgi:hypothetical protein